MGVPLDLRERVVLATPQARRLLVLAYVCLTLTHRALRMLPTTPTLLGLSPFQSIVAIQDTGRRNDGEAGVTRCFVLQPSQHVQDGDLPNGGTYIGLAPYALRRDEHDAFLDRSIVITANASGMSASSSALPSPATWDLLYDDWYGGFDQNMSQTKDGGWHVQIPLRRNHNGIFLVHYFGNRRLTKPTRTYLKETLRRSHADRSNVRSYGGARAETCPPELTANDDSNLPHHSLAEKKAPSFTQPERHLFYRRGSQKVGDVTIFTQLTIDRIERLEQMAKEFDGPISAAVYLGFNGNISTEQEQLNEAYEQSSALKRFVDIHLVFDRKMPWYSITPSDDNGLNHGRNPYPINLLRQIALDGTETEWVWYLEADMAPMRNARTILTERWGDMMEAHKQHLGKAVFVTPVYESKENVLVSNAPSNKEELLDMRANHVLVRIGQRLKSHRALAYEQWELQTKPRGDSAFLPYSEKTGFKLKKQEPYFIGRKRDYVPFDVLFMGVNKDKELHLENVNDFGFSFVLHPDVALINFDNIKSPGWVTNPNSRKMWGKQVSWRYEWIFKIHYKYREEMRQLRNVTGKSI
mmetsp:Transcript_20231/g.58034  ORF Transcript_20231/g.58034 Transcript_20231/m.58034 type:complete len:581 (+) Transcript_20231:143-1885(+)